MPTFRLRRIFGFSGLRRGDSLRDVSAAAAPAPNPQPGRTHPMNTWGHHMGVNAPHWDLSVAEKVAGLGCKRIKFGYEEGWSLDTLDAAIRNAHAHGLKCTVQVAPSPGSRYLNWSISRLAFYSGVCRNVAALNPDVMEAGNEIQNPQFNEALAADPNYDCVGLTAMLALAMKDAIHQDHPKIKVITGGVAPQGGKTGDVLPQNAIWKLGLTFNKHLSGRIAGVGYHPYETTISPLEDPGPTHPDWNAFFWMYEGFTKMQAAGLNVPLYFTEIGKPGSDSESTAWFQLYMTGIEQMRARGVKIEEIDWYTLYDGESNDSYYYAGIYQDDHVTEKPQLARAIRTRALMPW